MEISASNTPPPEIWQINVGGEIYEANLEELTQWIAEGSLLPQDRVRRGNLRWIEAQKVPLLHGFFNAKELGVAPPPIVVTNVQAAPEAALAQSFSTNSPHQIAAQQQTIGAPPPPHFYQDLNALSKNELCCLHSGEKADFYCETCTNYFCRDCPVENVCPMCGAACRTTEVLQAPATRGQPSESQAASSSLQNIPPPNLDEDTGKGANWFYWKAALTLINGIIALFGGEWSFFLGLTITQIFQGIAGQIALESGGNGISIFQGAAFLVTLCCTGFMTLLGYLGGQGRKWAYVTGLIVYIFDGFVYLLTIFSLEKGSSPNLFLGIGIHILAVFYIFRGLSALKK